MISFWSLFSATVWFGLASIILYFLRQNTSFLMHHGIAVLSAMVILTIARLLLPLDSHQMIVVRSYKILPIINKALRCELLDGVSLAQMLIGLWFVGALLGVALIICGLMLDRRRLCQLPSVPISSEVQSVVQQCNLSVDMICIKLGISTPMVTGLLHPTIYLPNYEYSESDLYWTLKHEASHIAGFDIWLRFGFTLFRCFFWWNPFVHLLQKSVDDILELRCDKSVLENIDAAGRVEYTEALYHVASRVHQDAPSFIGAGTFVQPKRVGLLAVRAKMAMDIPFPSNRKSFTLLVLSLILFLASYVFILQPAGFPPDTEDEDGLYVVSPENSFLRKNSAGEYELWSDGQFVYVVPPDELNDMIFQNLEVLP